MLSIYLTEYLATCFESAGTERKNFSTFFFCDAKQQTRNNAVAILRGILFQLLDQDPRLLSHILPSYEVQKERSFQQSSFEALWKFLIRMANDTRNAQMTCILDGLDECEQSSLEPLLTKLDKVTSTAPRLKIVVVSREYPLCLMASLGRFARIRLDPNAKMEVSDGLDRYISTRVAELAESNQYPTELARHVKEVLREKSAGTYLWVSFVIKDLRNMKISEVEESLDRFPRGLDGLYERILEQVEPAHREMTLNILRWCAFSGSVTFNFLIDALGITSTKLLDEQAVLRGKLSHCGHFISVTGHDIALVHQSAFDFLTSPKPSSRGRPWFSLSHIELEHSKLACACIAHIRAHDPKAALEDLRSPMERAREKKDSFLYHARRDWIHHFRRSGQEGGRILDEHPEFFSTASQDWRAMAYWGLSRHPVGLAAAAARLGLTVLMQRVIKEEGIWLWLKDAMTHRVGRPLLHIAAEFGHAPLISLLIKDHKAHVNGKDEDGNTPLHIAALRGHLDVVKMLVENGARIDSRDHYGQTPLFKTMKYSEYRIAEYLIECGADVNLTDKAKASPLIHAMRRRDPRMTKLLLEHRAVPRMTESGRSSSDQGKARRRPPKVLMPFL
ncbi:hypothetical protein V8C44DRAFT_353064 [Trichoderma aethiopicum]